MNIYPFDLICLFGPIKTITGINKPTMGNCEPEIEKKNITMDPEFEIPRSTKEAICRKVTFFEPYFSSRHSPVPEQEAAARGRDAKRICWQSYGLRTRKSVSKALVNTSGDYSVSQKNWALGDRENQS